MPYSYTGNLASVKSGGVIRRAKASMERGSMMVDVFAGIDRSTARHRIAGGGSILYEAKNIFPYVQGRLMRRKDYVNTNSRVSDNTFPTFPDTTAGGHTGANALVGNPVVKTMIEYNGGICILFEDSGDTGKLMMDWFNPSDNTIDAKLLKSQAFTFTAGGDVTAVQFNSLTGSGRDLLFINSKGTRVRYINKTWALDAYGTTGSSQTNGMGETFSQSHVFVTDIDTDPATLWYIANPAGSLAHGGRFYLSEDVGSIIKLMAFGYQTSSVGAYTNLIMFKETSTWLITALDDAATVEQVSANVGIVGKDAAVRTPFGLVFVGRDKRGFLNVYMLDKISLTLHTIGHPLWEILQLVPKTNYKDIVVSYDRNRLVRIALTLTGDANINMQEYWIDFYNGISNRTFWGPFPLATQSLVFACQFSGGVLPQNSGFFFLEKSGNNYLIREDVNSDTYQASFSNTDNQIYRTKIFDFGAVYGIIPVIHLVALANGARLKIYYETPKAGGTDDDTTVTEIGSGITLANTGGYQYIPVRIFPAIRRKQVGFKITSNSDATFDKPLELSQIGFDYIVTQRGVIE